MKTNFRRKQNKVSLRFKRLFFVLTVLVVAGFLFSLFRSPLVNTFSVLWRGENFLARNVGTFLDIWKDKMDLVVENQLLNEKLLYYEVLEEGLENLNETQEEMLSLFGRGVSTNFVSAGVLVHPPKTPYDILIIDAGSRDGIEEGDLVSIPGGGAIGKIAQVLENQSKVSMFSTSGEKTDVFLERGEESAELVGLGGGSFALFLPKEIEIERGDKVFLPGIESKIVAYVEEVTLLPTDSLKRVMLSGVVNINNIRFVEVH